MAVTEREKLKLNVNNIKSVLLDGRKNQDKINNKRIDQFLKEYKNKNDYKLNLVQRKNLNQKGQNLR